MVNCSAYGCNSRSERKVIGITFHRFPKDTAKCNAWVQNMKIADWEPTKNDRLCSRHFEAVWFYNTANKVRLLEQAVPTIFPQLPEYLQPKPSKLEEDMDNYMYYKLMKNVPVRLKPGVVPHIFNCQKDENLTHSGSRNRKVFQKEQQQVQNDHFTDTQHSQMSDDTVDIQKFESVQENFKNNHQTAAQQIKEKIYCNKWDQVIVKEENNEINPETDSLMPFDMESVVIKSEEISVDGDNSASNADLEEPCDPPAFDYDFPHSPRPKKRKLNTEDDEDYVDAALTYIGYELKSIKDPVRVRQIIRGFISQVHEAQDIL